jgi:hypothetical protein
MAKTKRRLSEAERAERRRRDRERLQPAAKELLTSEGWQRWVRVRAMFHSYSLLISRRLRQRRGLGGLGRQRHVADGGWLPRSVRGERARLACCCWLVA